MNTKKRIFFTGVWVTILLIAIDQITKYFALTLLSGTSGIEVIPGVFELFYLENKGAAFGMLDNRQWIFILIAIVMTAGIGWVYMKLPEKRVYRLLRVICILIAAGAVGNMIDRLVHHFVVDFLYVSLIDFPVFNIADCYVCIGAALMVIAMFTVYAEESFDFLRKNEK